MWHVVAAAGRCWLIRLVRVVAEEVDALHAEVAVTLEEAPLDDRESLGRRLLSAAGPHAVVEGRHANKDAVQTRKEVLNRIRDLRGEPLLQLQPPAALPNDPLQLGVSHGNVTLLAHKRNVHLPEEGQDVVLAERADGRVEIAQVVPVPAPARLAPLVSRAAVRGPPVPGLLLVQ